MNTQQSIVVPFLGAQLYLVEHNDQPYVPMKPVAEGMGLDRKSQHTKLGQIADFAATARSFVWREYQ